MSPHMKRQASPLSPSASQGDWQSKRQRTAAAPTGLDFPSFSNMSLNHQQKDGSNLFGNEVIAVSPPVPRQEHMAPSSFASSLQRDIQQVTLPRPQQHQHRPQSVQTFISRQTRSHFTETLRIGTYSLEDALLSIPVGLTPNDHLHRQTALATELSYQEHNPPILPPSKVKDLPPKPFIPEFLKFRDGVSESERLVIEARNNEIAAQHQLIDRQRNNQAAKKSRQARLEALANTRLLLNEKVAECAWFRMKLLSVGGSTEEWDLVPRSIKQRMIKEIDARVKVVEIENAEVKKKDEAKKRAERNKLRVDARGGEPGDVQIPEYMFNEDAEITSGELVYAGMKRQRKASDESEDVADGDYEV